MKAIKNAILLMMTLSFLAGCEMADTKDSAETAPKAELVN